jgi:hypothetical protein
LFIREEGDVDPTRFTWRVELWAEDEDYRLHRDDRARERVKVMYVKARSAFDARRFALQAPEVRERWPRANATATKLSPDAPRAHCLPLLEFVFAHGSSNDFRMIHELVSYCCHRICRADGLDPRKEGILPYLEALEKDG